MKAKRIKITPLQMWWLGKLAGYYVDDSGTVSGSAGFGEMGVNPGRAHGNEATLEQLVRKDLVRWASHRGGYAITASGVTQWSLHHPSHPYQGRDPLA